MSLLHMIFSRVHRKSLPGHTICAYTSSEETSLYAFHKGSYTVEAAIVIPIAAGFLVCILFFFRMLQVQAAIDEALIYAGRKVAAESSITDSEAGLFVSTELFFCYLLEEYEYVEEYVDFGVLGISLLKSDFSEERISLRAEYSMSLPVSFFDIGRIYLWQQNSFRKWTGDGSTDGEAYVYVTSSGEVYHSSMNCRSIRISVKQTGYWNIGNLRGKDGQKYYPCSQCVEELSEMEAVYYTDYGTLYHSQVSCCAIKRSVKQILLSEVGARRPCGFCYTEGE